MGMIKGQTVRLHIKAENGLDEFGARIYVDADIEDVDNVFIETVGGEQMLADLQFFGKRTAYVLHIPKGDKHIWTDTAVEFYGQKFKTYGACTYIPYAPLEWDRKIRCELYE